MADILNFHERRAERLPEEPFDYESAYEKKGQERHPFILTVSLLIAYCAIAWLLVFVLGGYVVSTLGSLMSLR